VRRSPHPFVCRLPSGRPEHPVVRSAARDPDRGAAVPVACTAGSRRVDRADRPRAVPGTVRDRLVAG